MGAWMGVGVDGYVRRWVGGWVGGWVCGCVGVGGCASRVWVHGCGTMGVWVGAL